MRPICGCMLEGIPCVCRKVDPELARLLKAARERGPMTPAEIYDQRVSWIRGMSGKLSSPMPSEEDVKRMLASQGIVDPRNPNAY